MWQRPCRGGRARGGHLLGRRGGRLPRRGARVARGEGERGRQADHRHRDQRVPFGKVGGHHRHHQQRDRCHPGEQAGAAPAVQPPEPAAAPAPDDPAQADQQQHSQQRTRHIGETLVAAHPAGERLDRPGGGHPAVPELVGRDGTAGSEQVAGGDPVRGRVGELVPLGHGPARVMRVVPVEAEGDVAQHVRQVAARLGGDRPQREVQRQRVLAGRELRARHAVQRRVLLPDEGGRGRPLRHRLARAQDQLVRGRLDDGTVGERHRPRPQVDAVAVAEGVPAIVAVEPQHVTGERDRPHGHGRAERPPAHPAHRQVQQEQDQHRQPDRPEGGRRGQHESGGDRGPQRAVTPPPQGEGDRHHDQEAERGAGQDLVLELDLVRVEQDRQRRQRRPPARQAVAPEQGVDHHPHRQAHQVLDGGDHREAVERLEQEQDEAVPGQPGGAGGVVQGGGQIRGGVAPEPDRGREAEHGDHPERQPEAESDGEQTVPAQERPRDG